MYEDTTTGLWKSRAGNETCTLIHRFYPEEQNILPAKLYCLELSLDAGEKSSADKKPFRFYDDRCSDDIPRNSFYVNFIMSRKKSDLLDRLIELEPKAEVEITYMEHSRRLQKIAPIPGWEYADGVAELCDEISNMYP